MGDLTSCSGDYLKDSGFDWTNVSQEDINQIFALCGAVDVVGQPDFLSSPDYTEGEGRDPFMFTANSGSWIDPGGHWLVLNGHIKANWHIGDNVGYPSRALRIRKVNHLMKNYIIKHFEATPKPDVRLGTSRPHRIDLTRCAPWWSAYYSTSDAYGWTFEHSGNDATAIHSGITLCICH